MSEDAEPKPAKKPAPLTGGLLTGLFVLGRLIMIAGITAGIVTISGAPKYAYSSEAKALEKAAWIWGIAEIVGGLITGFLFYVIAKIGQAVLEIWKDSFDK